MSDWDDAIKALRWEAEQRPPPMRRTRSGSEASLESLIERLLKKHGIDVAVDGSGMAWVAVKGNRIISGPQSSYRHTLYGALRHELEPSEEPDNV